MSQRAAGIERRNQRQYVRADSVIVIDGGRRKRSSFPGGDGWRKPSRTRRGKSLALDRERRMGSILAENVKYSCPECGSEDVECSLWCWVKANDQESVSIDWQTDVGMSSSWFCDSCGRGIFLPKEEEKTEEDLPSSIRPGYGSEELSPGIKRHEAEKHARREMVDRCFPGSSKAVSREAVGSDDFGEGIFADE